MNELYNALKKKIPANVHIQSAGAGETMHAPSRTHCKKCDKHTQSQVEKS